MGELVVGRVSQLTQYGDARPYLKEMILRQPKEKPKMKQTSKKKTYPRIVAEIERFRFVEIEDRIIIQGSSVNTMGDCIWTDETTFWKGREYLYCDDDTAEKEVLEMLLLLFIKTYNITL